MSVHWTAGYAAASPYPMTHARILHTSLAALDATISANSEVEGFAAENAISPATFSYWQPSVMPTNWTVEFAAPQLVDAVAIGAASVSGRTIRIVTYAAGVWTERIVLSQSGVHGDSAILALFAPIVAERVTIEITGAVPVIGVIYVGQAMVMERREFAALGQLAYARRTEFDQTVSEGGQWLGRSVARISTEASFAWDYLTPDFVRDHVDPFSRAARVRPFFIAPMPSKVATDCHLAWVRQDIRPTRMGMKGFQSVAFDAIGYARG